LSLFFWHASENPLQFWWCLWNWIINYAQQWQPFQDWKVINLKRWHVHQSNIEHVIWKGIIPIPISTWMWGIWWNWWFIALFET
jgi:hypothetical protein